MWGDGVWVEGCKDWEGEECKYQEKAGCSNSHYVHSYHLDLHQEFLAPKTNGWLLSFGSPLGGAGIERALELNQGGEGLAIVTALRAALGGQEGSNFYLQNHNLTF